MLATYYVVMLPRISHRAERTITRLAARTHPPRPTPLQPRDKRPHYDLRMHRVRYDDEMSQPHDSIYERERELAAWLTGVAKEKKRLYGWTTDDTIDESSIDRATWYRWKKISRPGNMPKAKKLDEFCQSLGLDPSIPYGILGWGQPSKKFQASTAATEPVSELDHRINLLKVALDRPGIRSEEQRELEVQLVRLLAAQRANEDALKAADEALRRHGAA